MNVSGSIVVWTRLYHVSLAFQCIYGCSGKGGENRDGEEGRKLKLPDLLNDFVLCGESEDLRAMLGRFC